MLNKKIVKAVFDKINENKRGYMCSISQPSVIGLSQISRIIKIEFVKSWRIRITTELYMPNKKKTKIYYSIEGFIGDFFPKCKYGKHYQMDCRKGRKLYKKFGVCKKIKSVKSLSMRIHSEDGAVCIFDIYKDKKKKK